MSEMLGHALRQFAASVRALPPLPEPGAIDRHQAVITQVLTGPARLVVTLNGASVTCRYLDSLTSPQVGQTVWVDVRNSDPLVIGRLAT